MRDRTIATLTQPQALSHDSGKIRQKKNAQFQYKWAHEMDIGQYMTPPSVIDWCAHGSLTQRPKGPFDVAWPRQGNLVD